MSDRATCKHLERKDLSYMVVCADCLKVLMPLIPEGALFFKSSRDMGRPPAPKN